MPSKYHTVNYRRFNIDPIPKENPSLEKICRDVLNHKEDKQETLWERANDRIYSIENGRKLILNKITDLSSAIFGELCLIDRNGTQALLNAQRVKKQLSDLTLAEVFDLKESSAPKNHEFIKGIAYWMAIGNHFFFIKMHDITVADITNYINWLIKINISGIGNENNISLQAEFDKSVTPKNIGDIRKLKVIGKSKPILSIDPILEVKEKKTSKKVIDKFTEFAQAVPIIKALIGEERTKSLLNSLGPKEHLAVDASIRVQGKRTDNSKKELQNIASNLADITDGEIRIQGKDGTLTNGDVILRTNMPFNITHEGSNLLDFDNVADQIQEVYSRFVRDKKIEP